MQREFERSDRDFEHIFRRFLRGQMLQCKTRRANDAAEQVFVLCRAL